MSGKAGNHFQPSAPPLNETDSTQTMNTSPINTNQNPHEINKIQHQNPQPYNYNAVQSTQPHLIVQPNYIQNQPTPHHPTKIDGFRAIRRKHEMEYIMRQKLEKERREIQEREKLAVGEFAYQPQQPFAQPVTQPTMHLGNTNLYPDLPMVR